MSFRTLLVLLFVSTVVIAQVQFPSQPSPSLPEPVVPESLPVVINKPPAPTAPTAAKHRPSGIRLAASVPEPEGDLERTVVKSASNTSEHSSPDQRNHSIDSFPRTASLSIDALVPAPRPLPHTSSVDAPNTTRVARLTKELKRKQRQLDEIQAEIKQLSQDIATADRPRILINVELFETVGDQFTSLVAFLSTGSDASGDPADTANNMVVRPKAFLKMLRQLTEAGQLVGLSSPRLITTSGRTAVLEVSGAERGNTLTITPKFENDKWLIVAECEDRRDGCVRTYEMNFACDEGQAIGFQMKLGQQFLIGLIHPQVMKPQATTISTAIESGHLATPLLPIPAWTAEPKDTVREVQWLDLNLDKAPVLR